MTAARLLLADDHVMVRRGLRLVLDAEPDLEVVAEAGDGIEALEVARAAGGRPGGARCVDAAQLTGLQATKELLALRPEMRVLMLSMHDNEQYLFEALKAGATGTCSRLRPTAIWSRRAGRRCGASRSCIRRRSRRSIRDFLDRAREGEATPEDPLTPRELQVLKLVAEAHTNDEIARAARHQPQDRRAPSREPDGQARDARPRRAHPLRDPARTGRAVAEWARHPVPGRVRPVVGVRMGRAPDGAGGRRCRRCRCGPSAGPLEPPASP